ncbi:aldehyde dehydrogenase family protein [Microbacterium sp. NPDC086615]|jgi:succinate-semialdehyde dehydrogenase/glutarate-semialdehyde dehydrogenase|nr:succinate-semialdehyde dehydrogenase [Microbacterium sp.]
MAYATVNPYTNETVATFPDATDAEVDAALDAAHAAYQSWRQRPVAERAAILARAADIMRERTEELARISTLETGRLLADARYEISVAIGILDYYAQHAERLLASRPVETFAGDAYSAVTVIEPTGIVFAIEPFNGPYYQPIRPLAPQLAVGNVVLLKHASIVPQSAAAVQQIMTDAGVPDGVFTNLYLTRAQIERVIGDPRVTGVTLTGSEAAGAVVAAQAGAALKKSVLELGGSDAMIILDDADLDLAVSCAVAGRMSVNGQVCISPKRMIVLDPMYDAFLERFLFSLSGLTPGDPFDPATTLAPMSSQSAAEEVEAQIRLAVDHGAKANYVGAPVPRAGAFTQPAVLTEIDSDNPIFRQEIFGPVPMVFRVKDEEEAIALANDSDYGLGGSVYTRDLDRGAAVAARIETGMVWLNSPTGTTGELPFHGTKRSGYGTELGAEGITEFANAKLIVTVPAVRQSS